MQAIITNTQGLSVLAAIGFDRLIGLAVVGGALATGAWLCTITLM